MDAVDLKFDKKIIEKHGGTIEAGISKDGFEIRIHLPSEQQEIRGLPGRLPFRSLLF